MSESILKKGAVGQSVKSLQQALQAKGLKVASDGLFGAGTEAAVKAIQKRYGLLPDGIVGPKTWGVLRAPQISAVAAAQNLLTLLFRLGAGDDTTRAAHHIKAIQPQGTHAVGGQVMSQAGRAFLYKIEAWKGVSNFLHWPGGASGVTLGPGYDMKERDAAKIKADLVAVGATAATAEAASKGAGLKGEAAKSFVASNKHAIELSAAQELALLDYIVPEYEKQVKTRVKIDLLQTQFDALVSFAYNPGGRLATTCRLINQGKIADAMIEIKRANTSGGKILPGLTKRRDKEVALFLYGSYQ